jgi:hypothetical protein
MVAVLHVTLRVLVCEASGYGRGHEEGIPWEAGILDGLLAI